MPSTASNLLLEILSECEKAGNPDMVYEFSSLSKVTFSGAGIAAFASSKANVEETKKFMSIMTIGYDKINQLRHVKLHAEYKQLSRCLQLLCIGKGGSDTDIAVFRVFFLENRRGNREISANKF